MEMISRIKNKICEFAYKKNWYDLLYIFAEKKYFSLYDQYKGKKKAFLLMEPEYGNLGDHAIAYASEKFIKDKFPEYKLISVTEANTCRCLRAIKRVCDEGDLVFIQGGGNMGSLYPYIERMRRFCVKKIRKIPVICLPVSVYFSEDFKGRREQKKSMNIYNNSDNLCIFVRDKFSYDYMKKYISDDKIKLVPDMVYYLTGKSDKKIKKNDDYLICLRKENESAIGEEKREILSRSLLNKYENTFLYDTTIWRSVSSEFREVELDTLFRMFARAKCVITDRMHGMIISFIMGTPCVVLKSMDTKILGSYEWIKESKSIRIVSAEDIESISKYIEEVCRISEHFDYEKLYKKFDIIKESILNGKK